MAIKKQPPPSDNLKSRVNTCLNKLSDRDTLTMATNELEKIARTLTADSLATFINCISTTDSSEKSTVRQQSVRLLTVLSSTHGDALAPHANRMIAAVLRRIRDPDTAVRANCVEAVSSITKHVAFVLKPLTDALFQEQDLHAQVGVSLCLSAAVEAAREIDAAEMRRLLPRVLKLLGSECFKAKGCLLGFVGSIVSSNCAGNRNLLSSVVLNAIEFLGNDDWAARKAAAEVLEKAAESDLAPEFKGCIEAALESRRFDKVKVVRETMNQALLMWKDVPGASEEVTSTKDSQISGHSPALLPKTPAKTGLIISKPVNLMRTKSYSSTCSSTSSTTKSVQTRAEYKKKLCTSKYKNLDSRKNFQSQVVPLNFNSDDSNMGDGEYIQDNFGNHKEFEDLSLIRKQLVQIENQQSSLMELLQKFIGSSQKGMNSLEKRVDGLERVLDEMSQDWAISTRTISGNNIDSSGNTCCMMPTAEFLSPKFWRKIEVQNESLKFHYFKSQPKHSMTYQDSSAVL